MADDTKPLVIPAVNQNVDGLRRSAADVTNDSSVMNADDPDRARNVIQQDTQQPKQFDEHSSPMSPEERAKRKAMLVQAFDRGVIHDRLAVKLPPHIHGEWVRNDPMEIDRLKTLGFEIDYDYAPARSLHGDGTGAAIVGDVVHMICPREVKELIDEVRMDKFMAVNGKPGEKKAKTKEEREFEANTLRDSQGIVPAFAESDTNTRFSKADVEAALKKVDQQTQTQSVPST